MQKNTENYIKLDKVSRIYGTKEVPIKAVDEISFQIEKGEFVVIVGPSGAGKTTVLNILGGMDHATDGEVWVDGRNIAGYNSRQLTAYRRDDIGFVFQFYNLVPNLTALENVELAAQICKDPQAWQFSGPAFRRRTATCFHCKGHGKESKDDAV